MRLFLNSFVFALSSVGVFAQETGTSTSTAPATTFTVEVAKGGHVFTPDVVQANVGDIIQFNFFPPNHSVVRAEYQHACVPYEKIAIGKKGFFSGFHPVDAVLSDPPTWSIRINDTEPIFYYCSAIGSCINYQMVGVINPNSTQLLSVQKSFAANSTYMLQPGEDFPSEAPASTSSASSASSTAYSSSTAAASTSAAAPATTDHKSSFPVGAIVGIAIGVVVIIALAAALFYFVGRHRSVKAQEAASGILGPEKGSHGGSNSPVSSTPGAGEPVVGPGGMVYVPVQASEFHRMSIPPVYGSPDLSQQQQRASTIATREMSPNSPRPLSPPIELYADPNKAYQHHQHPQQY